MISFVDKNHVSDVNVQKTTNLLLKNCGENIEKGLVFNNFDPELITGIFTEHAKESLVVPEMIQTNAFEYFATVPIKLSENPNICDEYFTSRREALDELVPQYANEPPSLKNRIQLDSTDNKITGVELGQYNGRVGVYKQLSANGADYSYHLCATGGAQLVGEELSKKLKEKIDLVKGIGGASITHKELVMDNDFGYARYIAENNVKRILYNAAVALELKLPTLLYRNVKINPVMQEYPSSVIPARTQTINDIVNISSLSVGIYREIVPATEVRTSNEHYVLEGPADPIYVFSTTDKCARNIQNGLPATTGRKTPLPINKAAIVAPSTPEQKLGYERSTKSVFWEAPNMIHPDVIPGTFNRVINKNVTENSFIDHLIELGLHKKSQPEILLPVIVKISNPYLVREQTQTPVPQSSSSTKYDYDE
jgi:hypothetical protein